MSCRRLLAYSTTGSADQANKRSVDELYSDFNDALGLKRKTSRHLMGIIKSTTNNYDYFIRKTGINSDVIELERGKTKSKYNYAIKGERTDFRRYNDIFMTFIIPILILLNNIKMI